VNRLSVVIPALNAAGRLAATLAAVTAAAEVVVVDGGSDDDTTEIARRCGARTVCSPRGRGLQIAAGVAAASGDWLLLLHADTVLQPNWRPAARAFMSGAPSLAGYFRLQLDSPHPRARSIERAVAWRSAKLGLPYGDQGLLLPRRLLTAVGGVRPLPLMEDVDLARRIGRRRLVALDATAVTSAERWERDGWTRRSAHNLLCLGLYFAGTPPRLLVRLY